MFCFSPLYHQITKIAYIWAYVLMATGWISVVVGFALKTLSGIEAMCVLQFSWLNVVLIDNYFILLFNSVYPLKFTFGYHYFFLAENS